MNLGSNIDPVRHLRLACDELSARFGPLCRSSVYRTSPVGFEGDDFLNMVVSFQTEQPAAKIVAELERLHALAGRVRSIDRFSDRTLDVDLLLYGDHVIDDSQIRVPREDILRYAFVLGPLAELAPALRHPVTGETMAELWARFDCPDQTMERLTVCPL